MVNEGSGEELPDFSQHSVEFLAAQRADLPEDERRMDREYLGRFHDRSLRQGSVDAIILIDCERISSLNESGETPSAGRLLSTNYTAS